MGVSGKVLGPKTAEEIVFHQIRGATIKGKLSTKSTLAFTFAHEPVYRMDEETVYAAIQKLVDDGRVLAFEVNNAQGEKQTYFVHADLYRDEFVKPLIDKRLDEAKNAGGPAFRGRALKDEPPSNGLADFYRELNGNGKKKKGC